MNSSVLIDLQTLLVSMAIVTPRVLVCLIILPGFSMRSLTGALRGAVALAIALPAALPTFYTVQEINPGYLLSAALIFKEAAIGCLLGVLLSVPIWVAQSVGSVFDLQRSPFPMQANNASIDQDASALGAMLIQAVVVLMIQAGLFIALARILIESFGIWPAANLTPPFDPGHLEVFVHRFTEFFWHLVVYGAPVVIPLLLVDLGFAALGVFAPGLQVSFASSPIKSLVGLFVMLVYWPIFSHYVVGDFARTLDLTSELLQIQK